LARHWPSHAQRCETARFTTVSCPLEATEPTLRNLKSTGDRWCTARIAHSCRPGDLPDAEASASLSDRAHSSQHTSTVFPPTFTLMTLASSSQSQAAQVFAVMAPSPSGPDIPTH